MEPGNVYLGRIPELNIRQFVASRKDLFAAAPFVLVSSIDSDREVGAMPWVGKLASSRSQDLLSVDPVVVSGCGVVRLLEDRNLFTGFDELWIYPDLPTSGPPDVAYITGPRRLDEEQPDRVRAWAAEAGVLLGLGDGEGLNFVARGVTEARRYRIL